MPALRGNTTLELAWNVGPDDTAGSIGDMLQAIEFAKSTVPDAALVETIKRARIQSSVEVGDSNAEALNSLLAIVASRSSVSAWNALEARFASVTPEDVRRVAARYLDLDHLTLVVAGDANRQKSAIESLNLGAPEIR